MLENFRANVLKLSEFPGSTPAKGLKYHKIILNLVLYTFHMLATDRTVCFFLKKF